jgi:NAD(P)-dependent dehydrogenase (short-subunit alcohol dehydrogenase family)
MTLQGRRALVLGGSSRVGKETVKLLVSEGEVFVVLRRQVRPWWRATDSQRVPDAKQLGLRVRAVLPDQLIEGTTIGAHAAAPDGALNVITGEAFMKHFTVPLSVEQVPGSGVEQRS